MTNDMFNTERLEQVPLIETREEWEVLQDRIASRGTVIAAEYAKYKKAVAPYVEERDNLIAELRAKCPHPQSKVIVKTDYIPGGYLDQSQTTKWAHCTICEQDGERHTTFGGFN